MNNNKLTFSLVSICVSLGFTTWPAHADTLRNVERGEAAPSYRLPTMAGMMVDSVNSADKVVVMLYIVAEQRSSERAAVDANDIVDAIDDEHVELLLVTADSDHRAYFEEFWQRESIDAPLALDPDRKLYADLGLIVFPTTVIIDRQGRLAHAISTHGNNFQQELDGYLRHTLGLLDDAGLEKHLKAPSIPRNTARTHAMRHRSAARLLREKNLMSAAEDELLEALEISPESIDIRLDLAELYLRIDRIEEARRLVDQSLDLDARHRRAKLLRGITLFRMNQLDEAETILNEALVLNPNPARTHYYLGRIHEAKGDKDRAIVHYRQSLVRLLDEPADGTQTNANVPDSEPEMNARDH